MRNADRFTVSGFDELLVELDRLGKATTQKASLRRALRKAAKPMAELAQALAPVSEGGGELQASVAVSTKLSERQKKLHRRLFKSDRASVEVFVGAGPLPSAHTQEFGTINHGPQPFMRPAWDAERNATVTRLGKEIWSDIQKTVARAEHRAARQAARGA